MSAESFKLSGFATGLLILSLCIGMRSAHSQNLLAVYQQAKIQDAQYQAARKTFLAALEKLPQARAGLLPSISLSANKNRQFGTAAFAEADPVDRDVQSWSWNAQLTQPLIRWANWVGYQQANAATQQAAAQFALAEQDLILRVSQAYLDVLVALQSIEVMQTQLVAVGEQLALAQRTYSVGTGTITDVHEAKAKWALSQAQRVAANNELDNKLSELEKILGEPSRVNARVLKEDDLFSRTMKPLEEWLAEAGTQNLQIKIQQAALDVARKEVAKSEAAHLPTLDLVLNRATNYNSGSLSSPADLSTRVNSHQAGVQLTIPLYAGGATQSRVREALALEEKAQDELTLARRNAASQIRQAFAGVLNGQAQIAALQMAVEAGENAVESNKIGFRIGTRINPDVLNAEQLLYASLRDLSKVRAETAIQGLKLKAAAGVLTEDDLTQLDNSLVSDEKN